MAYATWTMTYNDFNQLTVKYTGVLASPVTDDERWDYSYDDNGNLTNVIQKVYNG
ncbi:MAG: hypothetical protein H6752_18680, partial [Candidatus Omnitrophica bacterium]|nr:hypothetical protein [Candidatus Omnitrophota bacterium]